MDGSGKTSFEAPQQMCNKGGVETKVGALPQP
jgi:hypothetical protein